MRCRLSPDGSKLVICTTGGYLILIHDLDLNTLARDLHGFRVCVTETQFCFKIKILIFCSRICIG